MHIYDYPQGSPEWHALRAGCFTASQASVLMNCHPSQTRNDMLRVRAGASEQEFSAWVKEHLLDKGHAIEAKARPLAEIIMKDALLPLTGVRDDIPDLPLPLLASFDGLDSCDVVWECKSWNKQKVEAVQQGKIPDCDYWQVVQQALVAECDRVLYMVTDGTPNNTVSCWYERRESDEAILIGAWRQFAKDMEKVAPARHNVPVAKVRPPLPRIEYKVNGLRVSSNLTQYRLAAETLVAESTLPLTTDQEFAEREALCKQFAESEDKIKQLKEQVLGEFKDIDQFIQELNAIGELIRQARLNGDKQVKTRKLEIRMGIVQAAKQALADHIAAINEKLPDEVMLYPIRADFPEVMKGLRSINSIQDRVDGELARLKVLATMSADRLADNYALLRQYTAGYEYLFNDIQHLVESEPATMLGVLGTRIRDHKAAQARMAQQPISAAPVLEDQLHAQTPPPAQQTAHLTTQYKVEVVDVIALLRAVVLGEAPANVLSVNYAILASACADRGKALPGTTWQAVQAI